jgi:hypothetical protein
MTSEFSERLTGRVIAHTHGAARVTAADSSIEETCVRNVVLITTASTTSATHPGLPGGEVRAPSPSGSACSSRGAGWVARRVYAMCEPDRMARGGNRKQTPPHFKITVRPLSKRS